MLAELVSQHGARRLTAVLKQRNLRSLHLLRRRRFETEAPDDPLRQHLDEDEWLMHREAPHA